MAREFDGEASFADVPWGNGHAFTLEMKIWALSAKYTVRNEEEQPLMHIDRPTAQALATELAGTLAPGRRHRLRGKVMANLQPGTLVEHTLGRSYEVSTPDNMHLGTVRKATGLDPAEWTLTMPDGQVAAKAMVHTSMLGDFSVRLLDPYGRVSLVMGRRRGDDGYSALNLAAGNMVIWDAWGRPVGEFRGGYIRARVKADPSIYPLYSVYLGLIGMYELDPTQ